MDAGAPDREQILRLLGDWDITFGPAEVRGETRTQGAVLQDLAFPSSEGDTVPAYWAVPDGAIGPMPAVLYCHAHGGKYDIGRNELTDSRPAMQSPYLGALTRQGYAVLCVEMPCFGARATPTESALSKARAWYGRCLFGQMVAEQRAGLTWLASHPDVDANRIATLGLSMGGTLSWWLMALDDRPAAGVNMATFADLATMIESGHHDGHGHYMTVPGLMAVTSSGRLAGLAAPKPQLFCNGVKDHLAPPEAYQRGVAELKGAYQAAGAPEAAEFYLDPDCGHEEPPAMRAAVMDFLARQLVG